MSADTVCAFQLMYAVTNARIACAAVSAVSVAVWGGGGGDGYSCVACAWAIAELRVDRGAGLGPRVPPHPAAPSVSSSATADRRTVTAPPDVGPRTRRRSG